METDYEPSLVFRWRWHIIELTVGPCRLQFCTQGAHWPGLSLLLLFCCQYWMAFCSSIPVPGQSEPGSFLPPICIINVVTANHRWKIIFSLFSVNKLGLYGPCGRPRSAISPGEGNDNPLQYSCLENPMDRGAWWAIVHKVTKSQSGETW